MRTSRRSSSMAVKPDISGGLAVELVEGLQQMGGVATLKAVVRAQSIERVGLLVPPLMRPI
jgi:hypothetical protein